MKPARTKKCAVCRYPFQPANSLQIVCSPHCALEHSRAINRRAARLLKVEGRKRLMTRRDWEKRAQQAFNAWVRLRDQYLPCVSCGRFHNGQWHAGHYLTTGARPELRFEPDNCWKQCQPCNTQLSGNLILYRQELVRRIGIERVEWLEGPHEPKKYTADELQALERQYKQWTKELK